MLSPRTFYDVGVNYFETLSKTGDGQLFDDLTGYTTFYTSKPPQTLNLDLQLVQ